MKPYTGTPGDTGGGTLPAVASTKDPELILMDTITEMRTEARDIARDLMPTLFDKAINGKTKDALAIFESLADRAGFHSLAPPKETQAGAVNILNLQTPELAGLLGGLRTITQDTE